MMRRILSVLFFVFLAGAFTPAVHAQDVEVTWGTMNKPKIRGYNYRVLGSVEGDIFILKTDKKRRIYLERYGKDDLGNIFSKEIELKIKKDDKRKKWLTLEEIYIMNDAIMVFGTRYFKDEDKNYLFARVYDLNGKPVNKWEKIESISAEKSRNKGSFIIRKSDDNSKILVTKNEPYDKKSNEKFSFALYDSKLSKKWAKKVILPYKDKDVYLWGHRVTNDGKVFFMAKIWKTKQEKKDAKKKDKEAKYDADHKYQLLSFSASADGDEPEVNTIDISLTKKTITDAAFNIDKEGNLVFSGFYTDNTNKKARISGTFFLRIDATTLETEATSTKPFDEEFLSNFLSSRAIRKGKGLDYNFDLKDFIIRDDGGCVLIAEKYYILQHCTTDKNGYTRCYYTYHYDDVILVSINPDGTIKFNAHVKKYAYSTWDADPNLSYSYLVYKDKIVLFYNDHFKNYKPGAKRTRRQPAGRRKKVLAMATIYSDGDVKKESLIRFKKLKNKLMIVPRNAVQVNDHELIMLGFKGKKFSLGRFTFSG